MTDVYIVSESSNLIIHCCFEFPARKVGCPIYLHPPKSGVFGKFKRIPPELYFFDRDEAVEYLQARRQRKIDSLEKELKALRKLQTTIKTTERDWVWKN